SPPAVRITDARHSASLPQVVHHAYLPGCASLGQPGHCQWGVAPAELGYRELSPGLDTRSRERIGRARNGTKTFQVSSIYTATTSSSRSFQAAPVPPVPGPNGTFRAFLPPVQGERGRDRLCTGPGRSPGVPE